MYMLWLSAIYPDAERVILDAQSQLGIGLLKASNTR